MTDHYLLMTATPHKGDPENFCLFLELLDRDVYGDVKSLEEAMERHEAPFYLRRDQGSARHVPRSRDRRGQGAVHQAQCPTTTEFQISEEELDFYDRLTRYVEDQSIKAAADDSARGRALGIHDGDAPATFRLQPLRGPSQPGAHARQAGEDPARP